MSRRNEIIVTADPKGRFFEGFVATGETFYPGMLVQMDPTVALVGGRHTCKVYDRDADGDRPKGPFIVVLSDMMQGKATSDSYAAGARFFGYIPLAGDELNLLYKNVTGTADDVAAGDIMEVDDATGKLIVSTSTPETEVAMALEAITDPTADTLLWCIWSGY